MSLIVMYFYLLLLCWPQVDHFNYFNVHFGAFILLKFVPQYNFSAPFCQICSSDVMVTVEHIKWTTHSCYVHMHEVSTGKCSWIRSGTYLDCHKKTDNLSLWHLHMVYRNAIFFDFVIKYYLSGTPVCRCPPSTAYASILFLFLSLKIGQLF